MRFCSKPDLPASGIGLEISRSNRLEHRRKKREAEGAKTVKTLHGRAQLRQLPATVHASRERRCQTDQSRSERRRPEHRDLKRTASQPPKSINVGDAEEAIAWA